METGFELAVLSFLRKRKVKRKNLLLLLTTEGGDADAAYRIARCLQDNYECVTIVVAGWCKSAGTLVCVAANELVVADAGELGPIDVQIAKADELGERSSSLAVEAAFEKLQQECFKLFIRHLNKIKDETGGRITFRTAADVRCAGGRPPSHRTISNEQAASGRPLFWRAGMKLPRWYELALAERGVKEAPGKANDAVVQAYYKDSGHREVVHDGVPWCAAFVGAMLKRAGVIPSGSLLARSYLTWGKKLAQPKRGAIVVLSRGRSSWQGHVAFFEREEKGRIFCLGGNQSDRVSLAAYPRSRLLGFRWPADVPA